MIHSNSALIIGKAKSREKEEVSQGANFLTSGELKKNPKMGTILELGTHVDLNAADNKQLKNTFIDLRD